MYDFRSVQLSNDGSEMCFNVTSAAELCNPLYCSCSEESGIFKATWTLSSITNATAWQCKEGIYRSSQLRLKVAEAAWTLTGSSESAVAGESFTLTCDPQDSNAIAINWKRLDIDTTSTDTNRASIEANGCRIGQGSDTQYQYTCEPGPIYKLTIPANVMTNSQTNIVWRCDFPFGIGRADYTVTVAVPVSSISLQENPTGNQQVNVIPVYENTPTTIYCITTGCRPKANVTVTTTGVTKGQFTEEFLPQNGDLTITRVSQAITTTRRGSTTKTIQCSAVNIQGRQPVISQLARIVVYYIPSVEPTLTGYTTGTILYEGDNDITLTCQQSGGYPSSTIMWACDGRTGTTNNSQTVASSYVRLTVNRNLNGRTCTCTVRHPDNNLAYTRTPAVTFIVYYPPTTPTLQTSGGSFPRVENTQGVLKCVTTAGFPTATTYEWIQNGQVINGQTSETFTIPTLSYVHNGIQINCRVSNGYTTQRPPAIISNTLILDVQYTPIITLDTSNITIQEGSSRSRQCSAIGNPTPTVKWYRGISEQTSGKGTSATLVFSNIDRNQTDTYICKATSTGIRNFVSSKYVSVIVYYPPAVTVSLQNTTENVTNVVFTCNGDGFPTNYTYHGWKQYIGNTLVRSYTDFNGMLSDNNRKITIPKVTVKDTGRYYCYAENGIQGRQPAVLQQGSSYFDVKVSAKFGIDEDVRKKGDIDKTLVIRIPFYSNTPAKWSDIVWLNTSNGQQVSNSSLTIYELMNEIVDKSFYGKYVKLNGQVIILTISVLSNYHFGNYKIIVNNSGLQSSYNFKIVSGARPEPPKIIGVFAKEYSSISLKWERGFDGGYSQIFVILVQDMLSDSVREIFVKDDESISNFSMTIYDLLPFTTYQINIFSMNENGNSSYLSVLALVRDSLKECNSEVSNTPVIALSVVIVILVVVFVIIIIVVWRRGHNSPITGQRSEGKSHVATHYEDISQSNQETSEYEGINTDHENQNKSVDTYESLGSTTSAEIQNTYQSLEKTESHGSEGISMKLYENTKIN